MPCLMHGNRNYTGSGGGGSSVSYQPIVTSGVLIGKLIVGETEYEIFAPEGGGGGDSRIMMQYTSLDRSTYSELNVDCSLEDFTLISDPTA